MPATKSPVLRVGSNNAMMNPENAATIVNTGGSISLACSPTGTTLPGNHKSHCTI